MPKVFADISVSLDGFVAGAAPTLEDPLGAGGMQLHEWAFRLAVWRGAHGLEGGETGPDSDLVAETLQATGAGRDGTEDVQRRLRAVGDRPEP